MTTPNATQLRIRLKNGVLDWLRKNAQHNKRSLSAEIEYCAERYIENEETKKGIESHRQASLDASTQPATGADQ